MFCCLEGTAFSDLCNLRAANANNTYGQVNDEFKERLCGDECKRNLQIKLQNLKFEIHVTPIEQS